MHRRRMVTAGRFDVHQGDLLRSRLRPSRLRRSDQRWHANVHHGKQAEEKATERGLEAHLKVKVAEPRPER